MFEPGFFMGNDMWHELWIAFALMLVIEGLLPFISPEGLKQALASVLQMNNRHIRIAGLLSMLIGVALLYLVN